MLKLNNLFGGKFMDFKQFEYVLTIAKERSFSKAAKKLYISQPSLSQYINRLESNLKVNLFDRTTNPLKLTYEGEIYVETASTILKLLENMTQRYEDINELATGKLNIGLTPSKANHLLPKILPVFKKKYPGIKLTLTEAPSDELEDLLTKDMVDICLMNLPIKKQNIISEKILSEKIFVAAPKSFKPGNEKIQKSETGEVAYSEINLNELRNEEFILLHPEQRVRQISDILFATTGFKPSVLIETSSIETSLRLTEAGMGVSFVPESSAHLASSKNIKFYSIGNPPLSWTTVLAYRENTHITKAAKAFMEVTKNLMGKM